MAGGNLRHILNEKTNVSKLADLIKNGSIQSRLKDIYPESTAKIKKFFSQPNILEDTPEFINANPKYFEKFIPIITEINAEFVAKLLAHKNVIPFVELAKKHESVKNVLINISIRGLADTDLLNRLQIEMQKFFPHDVTIDPNSSNFVPFSPGSPVYKAVPPQVSNAPQAGGVTSQPIPSTPIWPTTTTGTVSQDVTL
jgi:hypothetical protein